MIMPSACPRSAPSTAVRLQRFGRSKLETGGDETPAHAFLEVASTVENLARPGRELRLAPPVVGGGGVALPLIFDCGQGDLPDGAGFLHCAHPGRAMGGAELGGVAGAVGADLASPPWPCRAAHKPRAGPALSSGASPAQLYCLFLAKIQMESVP